MNLKNKKLKNLLQEFQPSYSKSMSFEVYFSAVYQSPKPPNQKTHAKVKDNHVGTKMTPNKIAEFYARYY